MKRKLFTSMVLCLVLVPLMAGGAVAKTLKIGSMSPLTGPYASDGTDIKNGTLTAIEVFKEQGGVPGYDDIELSAEVIRNKATDVCRVLAVCSAFHVPDHAVADLVDATGNRPDIAPPAGNCVGLNQG